MRAPRKIDTNQLGHHLEIKYLLTYYLLTLLTCRVAEDLVLHFRRGSMAAFRNTAHLY